PRRSTALRLCAHLTHLRGSRSYFFQNTATTEIYTLSLHDALPIWPDGGGRGSPHETSTQVAGPVRPGYGAAVVDRRGARPPGGRDRKSTRLNSSDVKISYAVFCLKKKRNSS